MATTILDYVVAQINRSELTFRDLEAETGVGKSTLQRIAAGETDPRFRHVQALYDYFNRERVA